MHTLGTSVLENVVWVVNFDDNENKTFMEITYFSCCISLKRLLGFREDYKKILFNPNQQLILNRSSIDHEVLHEVRKAEDLVYYRKVTVEANKIIWKTPTIKVAIEKN